MYNFTLANFYNGYIINNMFQRYVKQFPERIKDEKIYFNQIAGSFPCSTWNGDINSCSFGNIAMADDIKGCFSKCETVLRLNFSNVALEPEEFENNYNRIMLESGDCGSTAIEISNLQLYEYIKKNYPTYSKFILSANAWEITDLSAEMLNVILDKDDFQLVTLPTKYAHDNDYISQIAHKNKIEICINPLCPPKCPNYRACLIKENSNQLEFSQESIFLDCRKILPYHRNKNIMNLDELKKEYLPKGITHFRLSTCPSHQLVEYLLFLTHYFIKEEFQQEFIEEGFIQIHQMR